MLAYDVLEFASLEKGLEVTEPKVSSEAGPVTVKGPLFQISMNFHSSGYLLCHIDSDLFHIFGSNL